MIVEQDAPVVVGSLRDNLTMGEEEISDEVLHRAIARVGLSDRFPPFTSSLDIPLGEAGEDLSGGERKRLCLARALVRRPRILLLDEATSHLDGRSEQFVLEALREIDWRCTVVSVAHRMSSVIDADYVLVLDEGQLVAEGTHADLLGSSEHYQALMRSQLTP